MPVDEAIGRFAGVGRKLVGPVGVHHFELAGLEKSLDFGDGLSHARYIEVRVVQGSVDEDGAGAMAARMSLKSKGMRWGSLA